MSRSTIIATLSSKETSGFSREPGGPFEGSPRRTSASAAVDRDPVAIDLGDAVGAARVVGGRLRLRGLAHLAEGFRRGGAGRSGSGVGGADRLEESGHTEGGDLSREQGLGPGSGTKHWAPRLDLVGTCLLDGEHQGVLVEQVSRQQVDVVLDVAMRSKLTVLERRISP